MKFSLKSTRVLVESKSVKAIVNIENGKITGISDYDSYPECEVTDYGDNIIMPGLTDTHVHINEPGRTHWEGFETATKSAAAGGITTVIDMPLNCSPVTTTTDALNKKKEAAKNKLYCDTGFYGGLVPGNYNESLQLVKHGIFGLKAFMVDSGIAEFSFVSENDLTDALECLSEINELHKLPLLVHAEIDTGYILPSDYSDTSFKSFLKTRPEEWENTAIDILIKLCRIYRQHIHIVHLSSSSAIELIRKAKAEGLHLTVETCPHYLYFSSDDIPDKDTRFKCTPPLRDKMNKEMLWDAVKDGTIDFIVSDHSPCDPGLKFIEENNFEKAWGGISGLQFSLPVFWTEAKKRDISIEKLSELMSRRTSEFAGLGKRKGIIQSGYDADIVVFNPEKTFTVHDKNIFHRHKVTPYSGKELYGVVETTFLRGVRVFESGKIVSRPCGEILLREI